MGFFSDIPDDLEDWWDDVTGCNDFGGSHEELEAMPDSEDSEDFQADYEALADLADDIETPEDQEAWDDLKDEYFPDLD